MNLCEKLCVDLQNEISSFLDFKSKYKLSLTTSNITKFLNLIYIYKISSKVGKYLTDNILNNLIFNKLCEIDISDNINITTLNKFYLTLKIVNIANTNINILGINKCSLIENLDISDCINIKDINFLALNLKNLNISYDSGVTEDGFRDCINIEKLDISRNTIVENINFLKKLKNLIACKDSALTESGFKECKEIEIINLNGNDSIININHLEKLKILYAENYYKGYWFNCLRNESICKCLLINFVYSEKITKINNDFGKIIIPTN